MKLRKIDMDERRFQVIRYPSISNGRTQSDESACTLMSRMHKNDELPLWIAGERIQS
jgi:hypothetical protein